MTEKIQEPVLGRDVLYVLGESSKNRGQIRSARISLVHEVNEEDREVKPGLCNLALFVATENDIPAQSKSAGTYVWLLKGVVYDAGKKPGTWHWPEHVAMAQPIAKKESPKDPAK